MYSLYFTSNAKSDLKKIKNSRLQNYLDTLLELLKIDPFVNPPLYKKLQGPYKGLFSRRINIKHRLFYEIQEKEKKIKILGTWNHYEDN